MDRRRRGTSPENFKKLDAILCNLAYFWGDQNGLGYHSELGLYRTKTVAATISIHTHTHAHTPILPKTPRISATIKSKFNFKNIFPDIVYNVKIKLTLPKIGGWPPTPPGSVTDSSMESPVHVLMLSIHGLGGPVYTDNRNEKYTNTAYPKTHRLLNSTTIYYIIYLYMLCNFICGLSDVIIKTFSQSVSHLAISPVQPRSRETPSI